MKQFLERCWKYEEKHGSGSLFFQMQREGILMSLGFGQMLLLVAYFFFPEAVMFLVNGG